MKTSARTGEVIAIHVLGAADLGVEPRAFPARLADFLRADLSKRMAMLLETRGEAHHQAMPPLQSLLYHAEPFSRVWLVATRQDPSHEGDTLELAEALLDLLQGNPSLFGEELAPEIVTVDRLTLSAFCEAIRARIADRDPRIGSVVVGGGGGPVEAHLGVVLGCVAAGILPRICETNRQDTTASSFALLVQEEIPRWLVRAGAFDALTELDATRANVWRLLGTQRRLDWEAGTDVFREVGGSQALRSLKPPAPSCQELPSRLSPDDWTWYRSAVESVLRRRIGFGEASGLLLARPWISVRMRELFARLQRSDPEGAAALSDRVDGFDFERLMTEPPARLGSTDVERFAGDRAVRELWDAGKEYDHGRQVGIRRALRVVRVAEVGPDPIEAALATVGFPPWPVLTADGWLVIECVGKRDVDPGGGMPMLEAVCAGLTAAEVPLDRCHFRLLASPETAQVAQAVEQAARRRVATSRMIVGPLAADYASARDVLLAALAADELAEDAREVAVAVNPGTKPMNLAAVAVGLQWSYDRAKPLRVAPLRWVGNGTRFLVRGEDAARVPARLAHDAAAAVVLVSALNDLDYGLARTAVATASNLWTGFDNVIALLEQLATGTGDLALPPAGTNVEALHLLGRNLLQPSKLRRRGWQSIAPADLWPARLTLYRTLTVRDPWRAVYEAARIAERCWPAPPGQGAPWRARNLAACRQIWEWRNESPLGHMVWRCPPPAAEIGRVLSRADDELRRTGLVSPAADAVDTRVLVRLRDALVVYVRDLARRSGVGG